MSRKNIAVRTLKKFAKENDVSAIVALIEEGIDPEYYLDQLCEICEKGSSKNDKLILENIDAIVPSVQITAARKIMRLEITKTEDDIIKEAERALNGKKAS
jgi:hypothetical protein